MDGAGGRQGIEHPKPDLGDVHASVAQGATEHGDAVGAAMPHLQAGAAVGPAYLPQVVQIQQLGERNPLAARAHGELVDARGRFGRRVDGVDLEASHERQLGVGVEGLRRIVLEAEEAVGDIVLSGRLPRPDAHDALVDRRAGGEVVHRRRPHDLDPRPATTTEHRGEHRRRRSVRALALRNGDALVVRASDAAAVLPRAVAHEAVEGALEHAYVEARALLEHDLVQVGRIRCRVGRHQRRARAGRHLEARQVAAVAKARREVAARAHRVAHVAHGGGSGLVQLDAAAQAWGQPHEVLEDGAHQIGWQHAKRAGAACARGHRRRCRRCRRRLGVRLGRRCGVGRPGRATALGCPLLLHVGHQGPEATLQLLALGGHEHRPHAPGVVVVGLSPKDGWKGA